MEKEKQEIEERLHMICENKRLESFKIWPYSDNNTCNAAKMAEAGFFWTGTEDEPDSAQCFVCNKQMDGWECTDDPWQEHKSHAEKCPFVVIGKPEEMLTCSQLNDLWKIMAKNVVELKFKLLEKELLDDYNEAKKEILDYQKNGSLSKINSKK